MSDRNPALLEDRFHLFDCATAMTRDRQAVSRALERRGLWHRDRLSLVVGNHDIFHTPHHGTRLQRVAEGLKVAWAGAQASYERFCAWAGELVGPKQRLQRGDLFPFTRHLGHVTLSCLDTTEAQTVDSSNARLAEEDAQLLEAAATGFGRHVLAVHHAPASPASSARSPGRPRGPRAARPRERQDEQSCILKREP